MNLSGPHSIPVAWEPVPDGFVHGILLGYRVLYRVLKIAGDDTEEQTLNKTTDASTTNITLKDLHNYAVYEIRVTAFTVKGDGAVSRRIIAGKYIDQTNFEGGKWYFHDSRSTLFFPRGM